MSDTEKIQKHLAKLSTSACFVNFKSGVDPRQIPHTEMGDVGQVRAAIGALYGADAARQKEANEFLVQHASTDAAWSTSLALVADDPANPPDVQYFGANMMYGKVKGDWGKLPEAHRNFLVDLIGGFQ